MADQAGKELIFLISQPRSGSTLTQKMLGSHPLIHTQSEPWVLLHPLHAMRDDNVTAAYDAGLYVKALHDFIDHIPGKHDRYNEKIAATYGDLYRLILETGNKQFFLDKTPRYYHIIDELTGFFPAAKIILLWRNPAAVLASIVKSWTNNDWSKLAEFKHDLMIAPKRMLQAKRTHKKIYSLKYEDLVKDPAGQTKQLCRYLGISFDDGMLHYQNTLQERWRYGDQGSVYQHDRPESGFADKWITELHHPQMWRAINEYIEYLGKDDLQEMGYDFGVIKEILNQHTPTEESLGRTTAFEKLLESSQHLASNHKYVKTQLQQALSTIKKNKETISELENLISQKNKEKQKQSSTIKSLDESLKEKREEIKKIYELLKVRDQKLQEQLDLIHKKESEKEQFKHNIAALQETLASQRRLLSQKEKEAGELRDLNREKKLEADRLRAKTGELSKLVNSLKERIKHQKQEIQKRDHLFDLVVKSYSFRLGRFLLAPFRFIKNFTKGINEKKM